MANSLSMSMVFAFSLVTVAYSQGISQDLVTSLPGQPKVAFNHYAGYVTANQMNGRALFYWFFEAASDKEQKPLLLWLNGGPGCSSVGYGATQEIGPFLLLENGTDLTLNKYAWNEEANLLFIESPVGVGYSYSNTTLDYDIIGDNITATDTYNFLQNWLDKFPEYRTHEFYIAGESYGGKYVPELAEMIYDLNINSTKNRFIDLKGFMVGNPQTHDAYDWQGLVDYAWTHAVASDETHSIIKEACNFHSSRVWENQSCSDAVQHVLDLYHEIDMYSLYTPKCIQKNTNSNISKASTSTKPRKILAGFDPCLEDYANVYYNRRDVQEALHVLNSSNLLIDWTICNMQIYHNWTDTRHSMLPTYLKLIGAGLRIWIYSGDTDGRVPVTATKYCLKALGIPKKEEWRAWYHNGQVSGWLQEYEGLTFATFKGAGHAVPSFKPSESLALFQSFLRGRALPKFRNETVTQEL